MEGAGGEKSRLVVCDCVACKEGTFSEPGQISGVWLHNSWFQQLAPSLLHPHILASRIHQSPLAHTLVYYGKEWKGWKGGKGREGKEKNRSGPVPVPVDIYISISLSIAPCPLELFPLEVLPGRPLPLPLPLELGYPVMSCQLAKTHMCRIVQDSPQ